MDDHANAPDLALIGAGHWGQRYIATLNDPALGRLRVVASRNPRTQARIPAGCDLVENFRAAVDHAEVRGVILATPPALHFRMAAECVRRGLPVLVEKPLTLDLDEALELRELALRHESFVMVGHTHLFSAAFEALSAALSGAAQPLEIDGEGGNWGPFRDHVDALWDYGPHDVAMGLALAGDVPDRVQAQWLARRSAEDGGGETVQIELGFADGHRARLTVGNLMKEKRRLLHVRCGEHRFRYDDLAHAKLAVSRADHGGADHGAWTLVPLALGMPLARTVATFAESIRRGKRSHDSLELGVRVVQVLTQVRAALEE